MDIHGLYAIVDTAFLPGIPAEELALRYLKGGAPIIQLRDKGRRTLKDGLKKFHETAFKIASLKKDFPFLFLVNDEPEIAKEVGADGVHIGRDDSSISVCREVLGKDKLIGYSSHSLNEALAAEKSGADYIAFGAIFPTPTKGPGHPVQGIDRLRQVVSSLRVPVVAIGGIGRHNIQEVLATGVASVAMISALAQAKDQTEEARFFCGLFPSI